MKKVNDICEKCGSKISFPADVITCDNCGKTYHRWCWKSVTNCKACGVVNKDYDVEWANRLDKVNNKNEEKSYATTGNGDSGMFSNIGEKLKGWARAYFVISVVVAVIAVIATFIIDLFLFPAIVGVAIGVVLSAWIVSLILYAFGEFVANSKESKIIQREILEELRKEK